MNLQMLSHILYNHQGYLFIVGGYVRDEILNKVSKDIDCELFEMKPLDFVTILEKHDIKYSFDQGNKFPVYRTSLDEGIVEIGFPRRDNKTGHKHTDFDIEIDPNMSVKDAAIRRDFTINAIYKPVTERNHGYYDPFLGISDLQGNVLRPVDAITFKEDPLRAFRAFQFICRFGFDYQPVLDVMDEHFLQSTKHLSKDSIYKEFEKGIMHGKYFDKALDFLKESGLLRIHFPELDALSSCEQSKKHHQEGNVWIHTKAVVVEMMKQF